MCCVMCVCGWVCVGVGVYLSVSVHMSTCAFGHVYVCLSVCLSVCERICSCFRATSQYLSYHVILLLLLFAFLICQSLQATIGCSPLLAHARHRAQRLEASELSSLRERVCGETSRFWCGFGSYRFALELVHNRVVVDLVSLCFGIFRHRIVSWFSRILELRPQVFKLLSFACLPLSYILSLSWLAVGSLADCWYGYGK
jgi:hypothetical protein